MIKYIKAAVGAAALKQKSAYQKSLPLEFNSETYKSPFWRGSEIESELFYKMVAVANTKQSHEERILFYLQHEVTANYRDLRTLLKIKEPEHVIRNLQHQGHIIRGICDSNSKVEFPVGYVLLRDKNNVYYFQQLSIREDIK